MIDFVAGRGFGVGVKERIGARAARILRDTEWAFAHAPAGVRTGARPGRGPRPCRLGEVVYVCGADSNGLRFSTRALGSGRGSSEQLCPGVGR